MTHRASGDVSTDTSADLISVPCSRRLHRKSAPADSAGDAQPVGRVSWRGALAGGAATGLQAALGGQQTCGKVEGGARTERNTSAGREPM